MKYLLVIACCGVLIVIPPTTAQNSTDAIHPTHTILSSGNGRYVFGQISEYRRDQYLLDTQTGRLWTLKLTQTEGTNEEDQLWPIKYNVLTNGEWKHSFSAPY
jgi:hypothetical protein